MDTSQIEKQNIAKQIASTTCNAILSVLAGGVLWQSFLLYYGVSSSVIGTLASIATFSQILSMFINIYVSDKVRNPIKTMAICCLSGILYYPIVILSCRTLEGGILMTVLFISVFLQNLFSGFKGVVSYKLPYIIFNIANYGRVVAIEGVLSNVVTTIISAAVPVVLGMVDYEIGMTGIYIICTVISIISAIITVSFKTISVNNTVSSDSFADEQKFSLKKLLSQEDVRVLFIPNFFRGVSTGIIGSIALIAAKMFGVDSSELAILATLGTVGSIAGNLVFSFLGQKKLVKYLCLIACIVYSAASAAVSLTKSFVVFLVLYTVIQAASIIVDGTIPVLMTYFIPYNQIGVNTSLRLIITNAGTMLTQALTGIILDTKFAESGIAIIVLLIVAGLTRLSTGIVYFSYTKKHEKTA